MNVANINGIVDIASDKLAMLNMGNDTQSMPTLIVTVIIGLLICFLGVKLIKVLTTMVGLLLGAGIGAALAAGFQLTGILPLVAIVGCAAILGVMSFFLYQFGVFLVVICNCFGIFLTFINPQSLVPLIICIVISVIISVLAVMYIEPIVIIVTGLSGGITAGGAAAALIGLTANVWISYGIGAALAVFGISVQFMMHSRKIGRREKRYSTQVKSEVSMESEVEKARKMLEDEYEDED